MSSTEVRLVVEGPAAQQGMIDAEFLAECLAGYSQVFRRANSIVNGEASEAAVLVESDFRAGSFIVTLQFEQNLIETATTLITNHAFSSAIELAGLIGIVLRRNELGESLIDLWKWLRGKKPEKVNQVGNNTEITFGVNKKTVQNVVYNMYSDSAIRTALAQATGPLRRDGVDRIAIRQDDTEQVAFDKEEARYFGPEALEMEPNSYNFNEGERDAVLIVSKIAFREGSTWSFFEQGSTVAATIDDKKFWQQVHDHSIKFGEGDRLKVRLHWKVEDNGGKLRQKNKIIKVYEVLDRPRQMRLDDFKNEEPRGRKFRDI